MKAAGMAGITLPGQTNIKSSSLSPIVNLHILGRMLTWWRHQMETFSALLAFCEGNSPVPGEFPSQRPVARSSDVFFDLCLKKWLSKQSCGWWFETLPRPLWRHRNGVYVYSNEQSVFFLEIWMRFIAVIIDAKMWTPSAYMVSGIGHNCVCRVCSTYDTLHWRHNERDGVSITRLTIAYSTVYSGANQRKHWSSASLAFVQGIHRWPVNSPHRWPVTRKMFPFDDVTMSRLSIHTNVMAWKRLPHYWPFVRGIHRSLLKKTSRESGELKYLDAPLTSL